MLNLLIRNNTNFYLITLLCIGISYYQFYKVGFSEPDDTWMILENTDIWNQRFSLKYLEHIFSNEYHGQYSPINTLYYKFIYQFFGLSSTALHIGSIILHVINTFILYLLITKSCSNLGLGSAINIAKVSILIWAVHPFNVETVIWISCSKTLLFCLFFMLSFILFLIYMQGKNWVYLAISAILYFFSCGAKEQACVTFIIPLTFFICRYGKQIIRTYRKFVPVFIYFILVIGISLLFVKMTSALNANDSIFFKPILAYNVWERVYITFFCMNFYIKNAILPFGLHYHYPFFMYPGEKISILLILYPLLFVGSFIYYIRSVLSGNYILLHLYLFVSFMSQIFLSLQIVPLGRYSLVADRYMYLPLIFILIIVQILVYKYKDSKLYNYTLTVLIIYFLIYNQVLVNNWSDLNLMQ